MRGSLALDSSLFKPIDLARFWSQVGLDGRSYGPKGRCWEWRGNRQPKGYGTFRLGRRTVLAHRFAYACFFGSAPADLTIRHSCDNHWCCQPGHLLVGTNRDNVADRVRRGRGHSILTAAEVRAVRAGLKLGQPQWEIAARLGVSPASISNIATGKTWRHVK